MDFDAEVCIIGGGPAGMMAAGRAAECGARVLLIEKNPELGRKLLITGGGRCNVTNAEFRREVLVEKYGERGKFLHSLFARFGPGDLIEFLSRYGLPVVVEEENRAFPATHSARSVLDVLRSYLSDGGVELRTGTSVLGLTVDTAEADAAAEVSKRIVAVETDRGSLRARRVVLATGGLSRPDTGSTGDGFRWLASIGHTVHLPEPSLVPVRTLEGWVRRLQGLSFDDVRLTALPIEEAERAEGGARTGEEGPRAQSVSGGAGRARGRKRNRLSERGKLLFTHFGLSGPLVLNLSSRLLALSQETEELRLLIDLAPTMDHGSLDRSVRESLVSAPNRKVRNSLPGALPSRLVPVLLSLGGVDPDLPAHSLTRTSRASIVRLMKALPLTFDGVLGTDKAIVTSGGVDLSEIDFRSMRSRLFGNLHFAGDILDFQRRSGGYSLQICWSSGWVAGSAAARTE